MRKGKGGDLFLGGGGVVGGSHFEGIEQMSSGARDVEKGFFIYFPSFFGGPSAVGSLLAIL